MNNSLNLLLYLFREMMHNGQALQKSGPPTQSRKQIKLNKASKQSKSLSEFNQLFAQGIFKIGVIHMGADDSSKYAQFATKTLGQVRLPLVPRPVESLDELDSATIVSFDDYHGYHVSRSLSISNANSRISRSIKAAKTEVHSKQQEPTLSSPAYEDDLQRESAKFPEVKAKETAQLCSIGLAFNRRPALVDESNEVRKKQLKNEIDECMRKINSEDTFSQGIPLSHRSAP